MSQFKLTNSDSRERVLDIINCLISWSKNVGSVYNHVVKLIYLSTPGLWKEIISRFIDVDRNIRSLCISISKALLKTRDVAPLVCDLQECLADRLLYDPDPAIRMEAMDAVFEIASVYIERICNPYLIKALSSKIGDREIVIRMEAIKVVSVCFKEMLLISNPKVIKVQHLFKMATAILWLYKDKLSKTEMKKSWKYQEQKVSKIKLSTGSPIDLPEQGADEKMGLEQAADVEDSDANVSGKEIADQEDTNKSVPNAEEAEKDVTVDKSKESSKQDAFVMTFVMSEMEKSAIETAVSDNLIDVTNEDSETKSANILILITYCDAKALSSFSHLLLSQQKLRCELLTLISSTRADEAFYSSFKFICAKFDYLDDADAQLNSVLLDLRNYQELIIKLEQLFKCQLSLIESVEVANQFVVMSSSSPSTPSDQSDGKSTMKEHIIIRSGVFFMDKSTLITMLNQIKCLDKNLSIRMASFIYVLTMCYPIMFRDQDVKDVLLSLNPRIHLILTKTNGIKSSHLDKNLFDMMSERADKYLRRKLGITRLESSSSSSGQRSQGSSNISRSPEERASQDQSSSSDSRKAPSEQETPEEYHSPAKRFSPDSELEDPIAKVRKSDFDLGKEITASTPIAEVKKTMRQKSFLSSSSSSSSPEKDLKDVSPESGDQDIGTTPVTATARDAATDQDIRSFLSESSSSVS